MAYLEAQATWYQWELDANPQSFELRNGVDQRDLFLAIEYDMLRFTDRFGVKIPTCTCGRYRDLYPDSARQFQKGLICDLCLTNGAVRTFTGREIRATLAPRLFAAGQVIHTLRGNLTLDAHDGCIVRLGQRVGEQLFVETLSSVAQA